MKTMLFLYNPTAGKGRVTADLAAVLDVFTKAGYLTTVYPTQGKADATRIAAELGGQFDRVVCSGGDGTLHEVVAGLMGLENRPEVGYIPAGSTNDFANSLHLPSDIMNAAKNIMEGEPVSIDVGRFQQRYFTYVASFGAFTRASYETPQNVKNALGHLAYILEGMKSLASIRPEHVKLIADGRTYERELLFGAVSNSTSLGGVLTLDPDVVDMNDGKFEIMLVHMPNSAIELNEILTAIASKQYECSMIDFIRTERAEIFASPDMDWSLDGEHQKGSEHIVIENIHDALRILTKETLGGEK